MAKRRRLTPPRPDYLDEATPAPEVKSALGPSFSAAAPIARVAGDSAASSALEEVSAELSRARAEGRLIQALPLDAIDTAYLMRDRMGANEEELEALMTSIRTRGQTTAIEVTPLDGGRFGLISGWRRMMALSRLAAEDAKFASVQARVVSPDTAQAAYVAMVEENEIRVNLSPYERAHIVVRALEEGLFDSQRAALQALYGSVSRSKRSKIGSFVTVVRELGSHLRFPTDLSERVGLMLSRALDSDPGLGARLREGLERVNATTAEEELVELVATMELPPAPPPLPEKPSLTPETEPKSSPPRPAFKLSFAPDAQRVEIKGAAVDRAFVEALRVFVDGWTQQNRD